MKQRSTPMRRLFYVPGLLSLVVLAPALMWFLNSQGVWKQERCITISFPTEPQDKLDSLFLIGRWNMPERNWIELRFSGGIDESRVMLGVFERLVPRFAQMRDTLNGLHVTLAPGTKWETVIAAVDILIVNSMNPWMVDAHDITVFVPNAPKALPEPEYYEPPCGGEFYDPPVRYAVIPKPLSMQERIIEHFSDAFEPIARSTLQLSPISASFFLLLFIAAWWVIRQAKRPLR